MIYTVLIQTDSSTTTIRVLQCHLYQKIGVEFSPLAMIRLNSGNFKIFERNEWNLNLKSSDCGASKIISNDAKLELISWELNIEIPLFSICVDIPEKLYFPEISLIHWTSHNFFNEKNLPAKKDIPISNPRFQPSNDSRRVALLLVPIRFPYLSSRFGHFDDAKPRARFSRGLFWPFNENFLQSSYTV